VFGYGRDLAIPLLNVLDAAGQQAFHAHFPANANHVAEVGDVPPNFNPRIEGYQHMEIFKMTVFYNQKIYFVALPERINKFRWFLEGF
jgi:hypothetical protein